MQRFIQHGLLIALAAAAVAVSGCSGDDAGTGAEGVLGAADTPAPTAPTAAELAAALDLTPDQMTAIQPLLETWRASAAERRPRRGNPDGPRAIRPLTGFLESAVPLLTTPQVESLGEFLSERRRARHEAMRARFEGRDHDRRGKRHGDRTEARKERAEARHQRGGDPEARIARRVESLARMLELDDAQTAAIRTLFEEARAGHVARREARRDESLTRDEAKAQWRQARETRETALQEILTDDQWTRYHALRPAAGGVRHRRG